MEAVYYLKDLPRDQQLDHHQRSLVESCLVSQALVSFALEKAPWVVGQRTAVGLCMQFEAGVALFQISYSITRNG